MWETTHWATIQTKGVFLFYMNKFYCRSNDQDTGHATDHHQLPCVKQQRLTFPWNIQSDSIIRFACFGTNRTAIESLRQDWIYIRALHIWVLMFSTNCIFVIYLYLILADVGAVLRAFENWLLYVIFRHALSFSGRKSVPAISAWVGCAALLWPTPTATAQ